MGVFTGGLCFCAVFRVDDVLEGAVILFRAAVGPFEPVCFFCFFGTAFFAVSFFTGFGFFAAAFGAAFLEAFFLGRFVFETEDVRESDFLPDRVPVFDDFFFVFISDITAPHTEC
jgi:hypothetical protein